MRLLRQGLRLLWAMSRRGLWVGGADEDLIEHWQHSIERSVARQPVHARDFDSLYTRWQKIEPDRFAIRLWSCVLEMHGAIVLGRRRPRSPISNSSIEQARCNFARRALRKWPSSNRVVGELFLTMQALERASVVSGGCKSTDFNGYTELLKLEETFTNRWSSRECHYQLQAWRLGAAFEVRRAWRLVFVLTYLVLRHIIPNFPNPFM